MDSSIDLTAIYDDVDKLADLYRNELINCGAVASGNLVNFPTDISYDGSTLTVSFILPRYYGAIEEGRKPTVKGGQGMLVNAIKQWLAVKSIQPIGTTRENLAYLIARKIHKMGFFGLDHHGKHPLQNAMTFAEQSGLLKGMADHIGQAIGKQTQLDIRKILTE